jgi:hypothetical protein
VLNLLHTTPALKSIISEPCAYSVRCKIPHDFFFHSLILFLWQISDMVAVARMLKATLIIPELDKKSFWHDKR